MVTQLSAAAHQAHLSSSSSTTTLSSPEPTETHAQDSSRLDRLMKFSGLSNIVEKAGGSPTIGSHEEGGKERAGLVMYEEGDGELSLEVSKGMLEWHAEALGRMVELSPVGDV